MTAAADSRQSPSTLRRSRLSAAVARLDQWLASGQLPALLIVIVTGIVLYAFLFSDDYRVDTVVVEGLEYGDGATVVERSDLLDAAMFRARPDLAATQISALPFVESVSVEMHFPGQTTIKIKERKPVMNVERNGITSLVAAGGFTISSTSVEGLPVLRIDSQGAENKNDLSPEIISAVRSIGTVYGPDAVLTWNPKIGLVMALDQDKLVVFGKPAEIDAKLSVLAAIQAQIATEWTQLDIRVPTRPSYR